MCISSKVIKAPLVLKGVKVGSVLLEEIFSL